MTVEGSEEPAVTQYLPTRRVRSSQWRLGLADWALLKLQLVALIMLPRPAQTPTIKHNIIGISSWDQYV